MMIILWHVIMVYMYVASKMSERENGLWELDINLAPCIHLNVFTLVKSVVLCFDDLHVLL